MNIHGPARLRRWLDEAGIEVVELEMLDDWYTDGESRIAADARAQLVLGWAEELGARHVKVGTGYSCLEVPLVQLADGLTELCTRAADAGTRIALEPMPVGAVRTPAEGLALIEEVGAPNAGLCIDVWHVVRTGVDYESLREIPGERIATIELIDGFADPVEGNLLLDGTSYRRLAGTGEFEVDRFLSAILATGYDGPFGDENISIENRARSLTEAARVNFEATMGSVKNILERDDR
jgi:sugar phosphate isomerase/epimerase